MIVPARSARHRARLDPLTVMFRRSWLTDPPRPGVNVSPCGAARFRASCVLAGNVGQILGGIEAFPEARPDHGFLELGVVTAKNPAPSHSASR